MTTRPVLFHVFPTFGPGGPQVRAVEIMNALCEQYAHTLIALDGNTTAASRLNGRVSISLVPAPAAKDMLHRTTMLWEVIQNTRSDLTLTYNWGAIEAAAFSVARGRRVLHAEDGFGPDEVLRFKRRRTWTRTAVLNRVSCTVVPSENLRRICLEQFRVAPSRLRFISNGVDTELFRPRADSALRLATFGEGEGTVFLFVGHLRKEKNVALLLHAFAAASRPKARLLIVGDGPEGQKLQSLAGELGIRDRVVFAGHCDRPAAYFAAADVFVLSSDTEQMPVSLLEAMASGLPALCTDVGDIAVMLGNPGFPSVVPPSSVTSLCEAIRVLDADSDYRARLGAGNRVRCAREYSRDTMIAKYEQLYAGLCDQKVVTSVEARA